MEEIASNFQYQSLAHFNIKEALPLGRRARCILVTIFCTNNKPYQGFLSIVRINFIFSILTAKLNMPDFKNISN